MTIAISAEDETWVIPVNHKDSPFKNDPKLIENLKRILENPNSTKILHNAKFDIKFLKNKGIHPVNIWDTKVMHHFCLDENMPKSLMDLAKYYFADELENSLMLTVDNPSKVDWKNMELSKCCEGNAMDAYFTRKLFLWIKG
jgi:DNA polymerase I-like protein with 3'-5' exonuclease and polymerase domains